MSPKGALARCSEIVRSARERMLSGAGSRSQRGAVALLAATLGLHGADVGTVSASASALQPALHIGHTEIGLLLSVVYLASTVATIPIGMLTDRVRRTRLLALSVAAWSIAMLASGAVQSYEQLLIARVVLGVVTATTGPTVASLIGDYFPAASRARTYGPILGGELVGTGIGFVFSGEIATFTSWRWVFWWLVVPGLLLLWGLHRLPEPARGSQRKLEPDDERTSGQSRPADATSSAETSPESEPAAQGAAERAARRKSIRPRRSVVVRSDPANWSLWLAIRYVFRIRTNVVIIVASALGYFFFSGVQSFILVYVTAHYGITQSIASFLVLIIGLGAVAGVFAGGRLTDQLLDRGYLNARILVPAIALFAVPVFFGPGLVLSSIGFALPLLAVGAAMLAGGNPPMDAARLDIVHPALWGRAEGIRNVFRSAAQALGPVLFGYLSENVFAGGTIGLQHTILICLLPLLLASGLALTALRTYSHDVAAVAASER